MPVGKVRPQSKVIKGTRGVQQAALVMPPLPPAVLPLAMVILLPPLAGADANRSATQNATQGGALVSFGNATVQGVSVDYMRSMIGFSLGPLVMLYGKDLQAIVAALNAGYACGLDRLLDVVRKIKSLAMLDTNLPIQIYGTLVAASSMTSVSLQGGTGDLMLKIGIISAMMQRKAAELMEQYQHRLPLGLLGSINSAISSAIGFVSTVLASSAIPAAIAAAVIAVNNGVATPFVAKMAAEIEERKIDCVPHEDKGLHSICLGERWLKFLVLYVPTLVPIGVAVVVRRLRTKAMVLKAASAAAAGAAGAAAAGGAEEVHRPGAKAAAAMKNKSVGPASMKTSLIEKVNAAVMSGTLLTAAAAGSLVHVLEARGMNTPSFLGALQFSVVGLSLLVQWHLEKFEVGEAVHPRMEKPIRAVAALKRTVLKPVLLLNFKILRLAGQKVEKPGAREAAGLLRTDKGGQLSADGIAQTANPISRGGGIATIMQLPRTLSVAGVEAVGRMKRALSGSSGPLAKAPAPKEPAGVML